jgi:hypothetical protein
MITALFRSQNLNLNKNSSFSNFNKLKKYAIRITIAEQRLDKFTNNNKSRQKGISELVNTLNRTVKLTKKLRINRIGRNDMIKKLIKGISKLVLTATQALTKKVTTAIRQIPIYTKLVIPKTVRFNTFYDIKDKDNNIEIVDHMPTLNEKMKNPKIVLKKKDNTVIIKKKPSKKRWKLLNDLKNQKSESARKVFEQILNLKISLITVKNILALFPVVQ